MRKGLDYNIISLQKLIAPGTKAGTEMLLYLAAAAQKHKDTVQTEKNKNACNFGFLLLWFLVSLRICLTH